MLNYCRLIKCIFIECIQISKELLLTTEIRYIITAPKYL